MKTEKATFGAGCFWHVEEEFRIMKGVLKTAVGYMGGKTKNPAYEDVCTHKTGHVEVCQVEYDPKIIPYERLLDTFWRVHDPTEFERQGPDIGSQYKSVIFYHDDEQKKTAIASKEKEQKRFKKKIVTEIIHASIFYRAEEYHQQYLMKRGKTRCQI
jgi:peptide-methionine (S)-S-oxide reductase